MVSQQHNMFVFHLGCLSQKLFRPNYFEMYFWPSWIVLLLPPLQSVTNISSVQMLLWLFHSPPQAYKFVSSQLQSAALCPYVLPSQKAYFTFLSFHFSSCLRPIFSPWHFLISLPLILNPSPFSVCFFFSKSLYQFITLLEPPELPPSRRLLYARWL